MIKGLVILAQAIFSITPQGTQYGDFEVDYETTLDPPPPVLMIRQIQTEEQPIQIRLRNPVNSELFGPYLLTTGTALGDYIIRISNGLEFYLQKNLFEPGLGPFIATNGATVAVEGAIPERVIVAEPSTFRIIINSAVRGRDEKVQLGILPADAKGARGLTALQNNLVQINNFQKLDLAPRRYPDAPQIDWSVRDRYGNTPFYGYRDNVITPSAQSQAENRERAAFLAQSQVNLFMRNYCPQRSATIGNEFSFTPAAGGYIALAFCKAKSGQTIFWLTPFNIGEARHTTLRLTDDNARTWDTLFQ